MVLVCVGVYAKWDLCSCPIYSIDSKILRVGRLKGVWGGGGKIVVRVGLMNYQRARWSLAPSSQEGRFGKVSPFATIGDLAHRIQQ